MYDDDKLFSLGWKNKWVVSESLKATLDLSRNTSKRIERNIEAYGGILPADTLTFEKSGTGTPKFTMGRAADYTNPATVFIRDQTGWSGVDDPARPGTPVPQAGYSKGPTILDKVEAVRLDLEQAFDGGWFNNLQYGINQSRRSKDRITDEGVIVSAAGDGRVPFAYPAGSYVERNIGGTGFDMLTFDPTADLWPGAKIVRKYNDDILSKSFGIKEKVTTAYVKADIDTEVASIPVRGNMGVQVVQHLPVVPRASAPTWAAV